MERAVGGNDFVIIISTPVYATRSNERRGGVGYEGDIMTAEALNSRNHRKFIPVYRSGNSWEEASPTWLQGKYRIDLRGNPYQEEQYRDLLTTLHGLRPAPPPVGRRLTVPPGNTEHTKPTQTQESPTEPIRIVGIVVDGVSTPRNDGTSTTVL